MQTTSPIGCTARRWLLNSWLAISCGAALAQDIVVGQIAPLALPEARELNEGTRACLEQINRNGGVRGRKFSFFSIDDELKAPLVAEKFKQAMARKPLALLNVMGSGVLGSLLASKLLDTSDVVIIGAIPGAEAFRQPGHERLFHIRSGDKAQLERILTHSQTLGIKNIHVLYQEVGVGQSGLAVLQAAAQRLGGLQISATSSTLEPASLSNAVKQAAAAKAQAYIVIGFPSYMAARVLAEGLRRIDGPLTPAALARSLHSMGELDFGGYRVRFGEGQVGSVWSDIGVMSEAGRLLF